MKDPETSVCGIFCSDMQWSEQAPLARSVEKDWLRVQRNYLRQLKEIQVQNRRAPIFIVGDLFEKWKASPSLLSSLLVELRDMDVYAIPGNHDMPNHNLVQLGMSGYWTLVEAEVIKHLSHGLMHNVGCVNIYPFPFGIDVKPLDEVREQTNSTGICIEVALVHSFIWTANTGYEGASDTSRYAAWLKKLKGYDVAVFGDNHKPFLIEKEGQPTVVNCGAFHRRHKDEIDHKPSVWLLYTNGKIKRHYLDTSKDQFLDYDKMDMPMNKGLMFDLSDLKEEIADAAEQAISFGKMVLWWLEKNNTPTEVKNALLRAIGGKDGTK